MQNNTNYLPSDIKSHALRETYYRVQKLLSTKYDRDLAKAIDKNGRRVLKEQFNRELKELINYYVNLSK